MFEMDFFDVGNPMLVGMMEELAESSVLDATDYIRNHCPSGVLSVAEMEAVFEAFDIDYPLLPHWLQEKFDEFDVY